MKPRRTHTSNAVYKLDGGNEDNDLWVERTFCSETHATVLCSTWEPTDEERAAIAAGANIELAVYGGEQPPVSMQTTTVTLGKRPGAEG